MSDLTHLSNIINEQAAVIRELREQMVSERRNLRDDFAIAALTGLVTRIEAPTAATRKAYAIADLMLEERK